MKCKYESCNNRLDIDVNSDSYPIAFCSEHCLNKYETRKFNYALEQENPDDIKILVKQLVSQTKQLQNELDNLKKIRKTYFGLFTDSNLKDENYKRDWMFENKSDG